MSFFESPHESLIIDGIEYPIDTDFRVWIEFQNLMLKKNTQEEKAADLCFFISEQSLPFSENTLNAIIEFFKGGDNKKSKVENKPPSYDFDTDGSLIYSAFLTQYDIDLTEVKMHWWKFKALFGSLEENHIISKVMWARNADTKGMSKQMKDYVKSLNESYPLDVDKSVYKMTLQERNQRWIGYVNRRFEEAKKD